MKDILIDFPVILPTLRLIASCIVFWGFTIICIEKVKNCKKRDCAEVVNKKSLAKTKKAYILVTIGFFLQLVLGVIGVLISS